MPELPEVHTTVRGLNTYVRGLEIVSVWSDYFSIAYPTQHQIKNKKFFPLFKKRVVGGKIIEAERKGKNILIHLDNKNTVVIHMKMTGHLLYGTYRKTTLKERRETGDSWKTKESGPLQDPLNRFIHLVFTLSNGKHLVLSDLRRFATVTVVPREKILNDTELHKLGPDPLEKSVTYKKFKERLLLKKNFPIKQTLMDQTVLSGIGNIYSDEILWRAGIHPETKTGFIPESFLKKIFTAMKTTLKKGIDFGGDSTSDYRDILGKKGKFQETHRAYRNTGKKCEKPGCKGVIKRIIVGQRSAHFCSEHQKVFK